MSVPSTIPSNCSVDVADSLRRWLWSLPPGSPEHPLQIEFPPRACYVVNETLYLRGFTWTTIDGNGSTFHQEDPVPETIGPMTPRTPYCGSDIDLQSGASQLTDPIVWWFEGGCDVFLKGIRIVGPGRGPGASWEPYSAIELSGVQDFTLEDDQIESSGGDFVTVTGLHEGVGQDRGSPDYPSTNVTISTNVFEGSGRQGITLQYVNGVNVTDNWLGGVRFTEIDLETDLPGGCTCNVSVERNLFVGSDPYLVAGLTGAAIRGFSFSDNLLSAGEQLRIQLAPEFSSSGISISRNVATSPTTWPYPAIGLGYNPTGDGYDPGGPNSPSAPMSDVTVSGNQVSASGGGSPTSQPAAPTTPFVLAGPSTSGVSVDHNIVGSQVSQVLVNEGAPSNHACGDSASQNGAPLDGGCSAHGAS